MANNPYVNKVVYGDQTLIDISGDTVTAGSMLSGTTAHDKSGAAITGTIASKSSSDLTASGATVTAPAGYYASSASKSVASGSAGTPTATKGTVSNHAVSVTPSVTNTEGYISGGTKTGTAVSVSASELVSGNKSITSNGTNIDVANYATCSVDVSSGWKTATGVITNEGAAGAYPNVATFTVEKEPEDWMIMQTKAFTSGTTNTAPTGAVFITPSFCLAAHPNSTSQINFVDKSSYVTERTKSSTSLRIKLRWNQVFFWAGGTYTLYYK